MGFVGDGEFEVVRDERDGFGWVWVVLEKRYSIGLCWRLRERCVNGVVLMGLYLWLLDLDILVISELG